MRKYIKAILILIIFSSLFGGAYAFTSRDIDPILRDSLFWGMIPISGISLLILGVLVILDDIKNNKRKSNLNQDINNNRVGSRGLFPLPSSHTTARAVWHTAVC